MNSQPNLTLELAGAWARQLGLDPVQLLHRACEAEGVLRSSFGVVGSLPRQIDLPRFLRVLREKSLEINNTQIDILDSPSLIDAVKFLRIQRLLGNKTWENLLDEFGDAIAIKPSKSGRTAPSFIEMSQRFGDYFEHRRIYESLIACQERIPTNLRTSGEIEAFLVSLPGYVLETYRLTAKEIKLFAKQIGAHRGR